MWTIAQLSSFSHPDRSDGQTSILKGLVAIAKSSVAWKAQSSEGANRGYSCHCGFSAAARPSQGIRWVASCGVEGGGVKGRKPQAESEAVVRILGGIGTAERDSC